MKEISESSKKTTLMGCRSFDVYKTRAELEKENKQLQDQLKSVTANKNREEGALIDKVEIPDANPELKEIKDKLQKMASIEFYKELEHQCRDEIDKLYKDGARPEDIILTEDGFGVKDRVQNKSQDAETIKNICNLEAINKKLAKFNGYSIDHIIKNGHPEHLNALTDLTVHYFTQSEKKAITTSDDEQLAKIWHTVREIYKQAKCGDNTKEAINLMRYTERYRLKHIASEKQDSLERAKRAIKQTASHLSYSLRPSHRARFLKQKMVEITDQQDGRKRRLEEKYGSHKSDTKKSQEIKLNGSRGKEQRELEMIIDLRKKFNSIKLEIVKGNLSYKKVIDEKRKLLDEARDLLEKCRQKPARRNLKTLLDKVRDSYNDYSREHENRILSRMSSHLTELKQVDLPKLEGRLQKSIRKYGNTPLRNALNDICSDGGFFITVTGTAVGWLHAVPLATV